MFFENSTDLLNHLKTMEEVHNISILDSVDRAADENEINTRMSETDGCFTFE